MSRVMKQPRKDELRRRLALAEARVAYLEGMTLARRWLRFKTRVRGWLP